MSEISVERVAEMIRGSLAGASSNKMITGTCSVDNYIPGKITFVSSNRYEKHVQRLVDAIILIPASLRSFATKYPNNSYIEVENVLTSIMDLQDYFHDIPNSCPRTVSPAARLHHDVSLCSNVSIGDWVSIDRNVKIGSNVQISSNVTISSDVTIGDNTTIYPGVTIYSNCRIGSNCVIHSGVRLGADGFRFEQDHDSKTVRKMIHAGGVYVGDRVEIGANSTVDKATFSDDMTVLGDDVKIDDQVHIGHNSRVASRSLIAAQTSLGGSVKIGEDVWIGSGATISPGVHVGDRSKILLNAVVPKDVPMDESYSGFYAMPHGQWKRAYFKLKNTSKQTL